jgi:hypothetical protein
LKVVSTNLPPESNIPDLSFISNRKSLMNSIRQFNKETLKKTNRVSEDEVTGERKTSRNLFCLPLQNKKSDKKILEISSPYDFKHVSHFGDSTFNV